MKRSGRFLMMTIALLGLILGGARAQAEDWPHWYGPQGDGLCRETGLLKAWPAGGPRRLWQAPLGVGNSSVAVAGGRVFTQFQKDKAQWAVALDEKTGRQLWKIKTGEEFKQNNGGTGPHATPAVDGPRIYILDALGNLFCLEAATGRTIWQQNIFKTFGTQNPGWGASASPMVDGGRLLLVVGNPNGAALVALDKMTGKLAWKSLSCPAGYASPLPWRLDGQRQMVFFTGDSVVGLVPETGKPLWRFPWTPFDLSNAAMPVPQGNKLFISSGYLQGCALIKVDLKETTPAQTVWKSKVIQSRFTAPILRDGYLFSFDTSNYRCVEFATGRLKWQQPGFHEGSHLWADGLFYILDEKGSLTLARLSPEKFEKLAEVKGLVGPKCWTMPVIANGRLYIRDESKLLCLDVKEREK